MKIDISIRGPGDNGRSDLIALNDSSLAYLTKASDHITVTVVDVTPDGIFNAGSTNIHNISMSNSGNMELIETETGALVTFGDGDTFYLAEIDKSGQVVNAPRPILYDVDSHTVVTATQIDENIALAYSKGNQALDESEVFFSVVNASDLSVVIPEQKVADGKVATNTNALSYDEPISGDHALGFAYYSTLRTTMKQNLPI